MTAAALAQEVESLLSLPDAVVRLNALIDDPNSDIAELTEVISHDPGLAARLLKLVNSAYYGFSYRVDSISRAVNLIGRRELGNLAMASGMAEVFNGIPSETIDMETFWFNSVTCGTLAKCLAEPCRCDREVLFIAGLLHAIGRLVFYLRRPKQYREVLVQCGEQTESNLNAAERKAFGFDHAELGAELCLQWKLPERLHGILRHHLDPLNAPDYRREVGILHVAADMAAGIMPSTQVERYAMDYVPGFEAEVWRDLGLPDERIPDLLQTASLHSLTMLRIVNPTSLTII